MRTVPATRCNVVSNGVGNTLNIGAYASANATDGAATLTRTCSPGITQTATATGGGDAVNLVDNSGTLLIDAVAIANGTTYAYAFASLTYAITQTATATSDGNAANCVLNNTAPRSTSARSPSRMRPARPAMPRPMSTS